MPRLVRIRIINTIEKRKQFPIQLNIPNIQERFPIIKRPQDILHLTQNNHGPPLKQADLVCLYNRKTKDLSRAKEKITRYTHTDEHVFEITGIYQREEFFYYFQALC